MVNNNNGKIKRIDNKKVESAVNEALRKMGIKLKKEPLEEKPITEKQSEKVVEEHKEQQKKNVDIGKSDIEMKVAEMQTNELVKTSEEDKKRQQQPTIKQSRGKKRNPYTIPYVGGIVASLASIGTLVHNLFVYEPGSLRTFLLAASTVVIGVTTAIIGRMRNFTEAQMSKLGKLACGVLLVATATFGGTVVEQHTGFFTKGFSGIMRKYEDVVTKMKEKNKLEEQEITKEISDQPKQSDDVVSCSVLTRVMNDNIYPVTMLVDAFNTKELKQLKEVSNILNVKVGVSELNNKVSMHLTIYDKKGSKIVDKDVYGDSVNFLQQAVDEVLGEKKPENECSTEKTYFVVDSNEK